MGEVISFAMRKGGVGKTTSCLLTAYLLAERLKEQRSGRVLAVDLDNQGNLTDSLVEQVEDVEGFTVYEALRGDIGIESCLFPVYDHLDLLPSNRELGAFNEWLILNREELGESFLLMLDVLLEPVRDRYDYILIDLAPSEDYTAMNGMAASDHIVLVCQTEMYAVKQLKQTLHTIEDARELTGQALPVAGVLPTLFDTRLNNHITALEALKDVYGGILFPVQIRRLTRFAEATALGIGDVRKSDLEADYGVFVEELIQRVQQRQERQAG